MTSPARTAIVTGGASGIGRASARLLADRGVRVAEIAFMIVALTDPAASFVNGAVVTVDGGMTTQGR